MSDAEVRGRTRNHRGAALREGERVTPLELFFDLVFVLAITQCTALMAADPGWTGVGRGLLVLALLWWSWVGYAWLTSVVDPEEGAVRIVIFAAMAALLVVSLCVPEAFGDLGTTFAVAYGVVRASHIALFFLASRDDPELRRSVAGLAGGTAVGVALVIGGSLADPGVQAAVWALALVLDYGEPFVFGADGWRLEPSHFAERHGLIVIIALGESIVAIGVGAEHGVDGGVVLAGVLGVVLAALSWWAYFDVGVYIASRSLLATAEGRERNEMARDAYSYLHFPIVAGIVLVALGLKSVLAHVDEPLGAVPTFALLGGLALYLLGNVASKLRTARLFSPQRLVAAVVLLALVPLLRDLDAVVPLSVASALMVALIAYEVVHFAEQRREIRHQYAAHHHDD